MARIKLLGGAVIAMAVIVGCDTKKDEPEPPPVPTTPKTKPQARAEGLRVVMAAKPQAAGATLRTFV